jgi:hypothetical protein
VLIHALCWVHAERLVHKLIPLVEHAVMKAAAAGIPLPA